jgi:peptidoglycan/xylan/chitin deacetylase (PgdA/CDA1 family)
VKRDLWLELLRRLGRRRSLVLCHHGVGTSSPEVDPLFLQVPPERLRAQLELLAAAGFSFVTASELAGQLDGGGIAPGQLALTFDDGMGDNLTAALPLLQELGVPATFYIATGYTGQANPWMRGDGHRMMTAEELRALAAAGMELGAHTVTHPDLARLDHDACLAEMRGSADALEAMTGRRWPTFAYPYGNYGPAAHAAARDAGFTLAFTTDDRGAWDDRYAIPRALLWGKDRMPSFAAKAVGAFWPVFRHPVVAAARGATRPLRRRARGAAPRHGID